jgi:hypothetical protein
MSDNDQVQVTEYKTEYNPDEEIIQTENVDHDEYGANQEINDALFDDQYEEDMEENQNKKYEDEISELQTLIENYKKHIEDLQQSSENYLAFNEMLKTQIEERDKKIFNIEQENKKKNERIKILEENVKDLKTEVDAKEIIISDLKSSYEIEKSNILLENHKIYDEIELLEDKLKQSGEIEKTLKEEIAWLKKEPKEKNSGEQSEIVKNYKNLIDNQKETIKNYEKANATLLKEKSNLSKENENYIEQIMDLEKKINEKEKSSNELQKEIENLKSLTKEIDSVRREKNYLEKILDDKAISIKSKEKEIQILTENLKIEKEMMSEALNKKFFEYEVEFEHHREINRLLEQKNTDLQNFIRSQKGAGNEEVKKMFRELTRKIKIYLVDYEYLIDRRIIANILSKYFEKSNNEKKIKKPLLETLANIVEFDNKTRKILGISSSDLNNKTNDKGDSYREQYNEIEDIMQKISELTNMIESL